MNRRALTPWTLLVPGVVLMGVFLLVPIGYGFWISLHDFNGFVVGRWTGLTNYIGVFRDTAFQSALVHTVCYAAMVVVGKNVAGLALALLVGLAIPGIRIFRTLLFLPVTLNIVVIGAFWSNVLSASRFGGLLNHALGALGLGMLEQSWLTTPGLALVSVAAVEIWRWAGLHMLLFLAGMQSIDPALYEAARLDGANAWNRFRHVTLPQLKPILLVSTLIALMGAFVRSFDIVWVLTRASFGTQVVVTQLYTEAFQFGHFERATAMGFILLAVIASICSIYWLLARKEDRA